MKHSTLTTPLFTHVKERTPGVNLMLGVTLGWTNIMRVDRGVGGLEKLHSVQASLCFKGTPDRRLSQLML